MNAKPFGIFPMLAILIIIKKWFQWVKIPWYSNNYIRPSDRTPVFSNNDELSILAGRQTYILCKYRNVMHGAEQIYEDVFVN